MTATGALTNDKVFLNQGDNIVVKTDTTSLVNPGLPFFIQGSYAEP
jgi:hypothetical protein